MKNLVSNFFIRIKTLQDLILDIIFPPCCIICGKLASHYICSKCEKRFEKYRKNEEIDNRKILENKLNYLKLECNNEIKSNYESEENDYKMQNCINTGYKDTKNKFYLIDNQKFYWDKLIYVFKYDGIVRKTLLEYKFNSKPYISNFFSYEILKSKKVYENLKLCDIIVPVPMDKKKLRKRGYNQAELISKILSQKARIVEENLLEKTRHTETQSLLENEARKKNVENAFCIKNPELVKDRRVVVFDDIFTTGATANEISRILKEAGAKEIIVLVIAKN